MFMMLIAEPHSPKIKYEDYFASLNYLLLFITTLRGFEVINFSPSIQIIISERYLTLPSDLVQCPS